MLSQSTNVTDRETDEQTTCDRKTALCTSASRGKNTQTVSTKSELCYCLDRFKSIGYSCLADTAEKVHVANEIISACKENTRFQR